MSGGASPAPRGRQAWDFRRTAPQRGQVVLNGERLHRANAWAMVCRRGKAAVITTEVCNHTFRGTGIIAYLEKGGTLEKARQMAAHASTRTTQLYDRREDRVTLDEVRRTTAAPSPTSMRPSKSTLVSQ